MDVILDEINSYEDSPSELIFDEFENLLYKGHALGHNILGDEGSLLRFDSESGRSFMRRFYAPENMVFFSMGRKDFKNILKSAESALSDISFPMAERIRKAPDPIELAYARSIKIPINPCTDRCRAFSMHRQKTHPFVLVEQYLRWSGHE